MNSKQVVLIFDIVQIPVVIKMVFLFFLDQIFFLDKDFKKLK